MGIAEDEIKALNSKLEALELRIKNLEQRSFGTSGKTADEIRMILIGPPGAGKSGLCPN